MAKKAVDASTVTVSNTALTISSWSFGANDLAQADVAYITPVDADIVVLWTGETPTASFGHVVTQDSMLEIEGTDNIGNIAIIRKSGTDAEVTISLEK